eukprot:1194602-Prorocentrum_minimum.AAC.3
MMSPTGSVIRSYLYAEAGLTPSGCCILLTVSQHACLRVIVVCALRSRLLVKADGFKLSGGVAGALLSWCRDLLDHLGGVRQPSLGALVGGGGGQVRQEVRVAAAHFQEPPDGQPRALYRRSPTSTK